MEHHRGSGLEGERDVLPVINHAPSPNKALQVWFGNTQTNPLVSGIRYSCRVIVAPNKPSGPGTRPSFKTAAANKLGVKTLSGTFKCT